jgi:hypothetical protein
MSKLSMEALMQRADAVATVDLLNSISGGTENDCHPGSGATKQELEEAERQRMIKLLSKPWDPNW